jgi:hypothetical protein
VAPEVTDAFAVVVVGVVVVVVVVGSAVVDADELVADEAVTPVDLAIVVLEVVVPAVVAVVAGTVVVVVVAFVAEAARVVWLARLANAAVPTMEPPANQMVAVRARRRPRLRDGRGDGGRWSVTVSILLGRAVMRLIRVWELSGCRGGTRRRSVNRQSACEERAARRGVWRSNRPVCWMHIAGLTRLVRNAFLGQSSQLPRVRGGVVVPEDLIPPPNPLIPPGGGVPPSPEPPAGAEVAVADDVVVFAVDVPRARWRRNSRVPWLAVVTKDPKLGFGTFQVANRIGMSPWTSSPSSNQSPVVAEMRTTTGTGSDKPLSSINAPH